MKRYLDAQITEAIRSIGDNGGPDIFSEASAKMRWAKINITELLDGIEQLTWEQKGYYLTVIFKMYARMGGLPYDERDGARILGCDVRFYRRLRDEMVAVGKLYIEDGHVKNKRVEREIEEFCRETRRRQDAARAREERKRQTAVDPHSEGKLQGGLLPDFFQTSPGLQEEVPEKFSGSQNDFLDKFSEKPNEINVCSATTVEKTDHNCTTNQNQNQNQKVREVKSLSETSSDDDVRRTKPKAKNTYTEDFELFWREYPDTRNNSKTSAFAEWRKLQAHDRDLAQRSLCGFLRYCRENPDYRCIHAERYLKYHRFDGYIQASATSQTAEDLTQMLSAMSDDEQLALVRTYANGTWPRDKLSFQPGHKNCPIRSSVYRAAGIDERTYDDRGIKR